MRPILFATGLIATVVLAQPSFAKDDKAFLRDAIQENLSEISFGKLAQERSQNADVKSYGQALVTDHTEANNKAIALAQQLNVTLPTRPSYKQRAMMAVQKAYSKASFDRHFVSHMVKDHQQDIAEFDKQSKGTGPVAEFAKATLPTLQRHLDAANSLKPKVTATSMGKSMKTQLTTGSSTTNAPPMPSTMPNQNAPAPAMPAPAATPPAGMQK